MVMWVWHISRMRIKSLRHVAWPVRFELVSSPDPAPKEGRRVWGLASVFLVVHHQQFCFQVNQSDHSFGTVIRLTTRRNVTVEPTNQSDSRFV